MASGLVEFVCVRVCLCAYVCVSAYVCACVCEEDYTNRGHAGPPVAGEMAFLLG